MSEGLPIKTQESLVVESIEQLQSVLSRHRIAFETWGSEPDEKTVAHLLKEIQEGESRLESRNGELLRVIKTVAVNVYYVAEDSTKEVLVEDRQERVDGKVKRRSLSTSLGEKIKMNAEPNGEVSRALEEELGITGAVAITPTKIEERDPLSSGSYPGLKTVNTLYHYDVFLTKEQYETMRMEEEQPDKTTYFRWDKKEDPEV